MKKILISFMIMFVFSFSSVQATLLSTQYPGGKNYLDEQNFVFEDTQIITIDPIKVKPNTYYTLSIPPSDLIGEPQIYIVGEEDYIMGSPSSNGCDIGSMIVCTFYNMDEFIQIHIEGAMLGLYYSYYGFELFQLEEGEHSTSFEYYLEPLNDTTNPEFANTGAYITDYNDTTPIEEIVRDHVTAIDEIDGDISDQIIIVEDNYTSFMGVIGEYTVLLEVEDSSSNKATFTLVVMVKDEIPPIINGPDNVIVDVMDQKSVTSIIDEHMSVIDQYDGVLSYQIIQDEYTNYKDTIGTYQVIIESEDASQNKTTKIISITVSDMDSPILESSNEYRSPIDQVESLEEILGNISITDNYDDTVSIEIISDNYTSNEQTVGS